MCSPKQSIGVPTLTAEVQAMKRKREAETRQNAAQHQHATQDAQRWAQDKEQQQLALAGQRFAHRHRRALGPNPSLRGSLPADRQWPWHEVRHER